MMPIGAVGAAAFIVAWVLLVGSIVEYGLATEDEILDTVARRRVPLSWLMIVQWARMPRTEGAVQPLMRLTAIRCVGRR
jgi:hypothetical protein